MFHCEQSRRYNSIWNITLYLLDSLLVNNEDIGYNSGQWTPVAECQHEGQGKVVGWLRILRSHCEDIRGGTVSCHVLATLNTGTEDADAHL